MTHRTSTSTSTATSPTARTIIGAALALSLAGTASAGLFGPEDEIHTKPFAINFAGPNLVNLTFPGFSTNNGQRELLSITLNIDGTATMDVGFENLSAFPINLAILFGPQLNITAKAGPTTQSFAIQGAPLVDATLDLAAADAPAPNQSGPDYVFFGTVTGPIEGEKLVALPGTAFANNATDAGTVGIDMSAAHYLSFPSPPPPGVGIRRWVSDYTVNGNATLTYTFQIVPTPGTIGLAWLALGLLALRRR